MIDNYFSSGNVYVIDDQINEATPIINSLYSHQIPNIYLNGSSKSLPKEKKYVRLIFLDLNLKPSLNPVDKKSFKNIHAGILNRLLANNSNSYLILVWSKQEDTYLTDFKEIFTDPTNEFGLNDKNPLEIVSLEKKDFFETTEDENGIIYNWKKGKEDELLRLIEDRLTQNEAFKILSTWETLICKSGSKTVDSLFELVKEKNQTNFNSKLNNIVTSLSISFMGIDKFSSATNQEKTDAFMLALSELIDDEIDREVISKKQPEFNGWSTKRIKDIEKAQLNSKLLISIETTQKEITGSVFIVEKKDHDYLKMLSDCLGQDRSKFKKSFATTKATDVDLDEKTYKARLAGELIANSNKFIPIEINLTPLCDVVQNKQEYYRIVPGFLLDSESAKYLLTNTDRNYFSPLLYDSSFPEAYIIVLDYRFLYSTSEERMKEKMKSFSLRKSFVDDIQSKLANHVSRLGMLYLS